MRRSMGHSLKMGATVGSLVGLLTTVLAVGWVWLADTQAGTDNATKLVGPIALVCLGGSTISVMLAYAIRYARVEMVQVLQQNRVPGGYGPSIDREWATEEEEQWDEEETPLPPLPEGPDTTLGDQIAQCAYRQAQWHYAFKREPTRAAFERDGTSQPIWNSGRDVLKQIGMVNETGWVSWTWAEAERILERIYVDPDRIWVPHDRGLIPVRYGSQLINNRHIPPPQDTV